MFRRIAFLLHTYFLTLGIFLAAKVVFMLCQRGLNYFTLVDMLSVLRHGLSLDLSTSLYVFAIPFLLTIADVWVSVPRRLLRIYFGFIAVAMSLAFVADTSLYSFWHFKLDASCLQYLETPTEAMASVSTGYLLIRLVIFLALAYVLYEVYDRMVAAVLYTDAFDGWSAILLFTKFLDRWPSLYLRGAESLMYVLLIPLMVIGMRGGLRESTTNIGQVYFSDRQFLNHSAVNPLFSFFSSVAKSGDYLVSYDFYSEEECKQLTDSLFIVGDDATDALLKTQRPNIIFVIMESCGGQFTEIGGRADIMPNLSRLSCEGIFFAECYANSWRTDKGVVSILSGYPALPITSVMKIPEKSRKLPSIAASLQKEGYRNSFFYGGDINFTNMRSYVMSSGYNKLQWRDDYMFVDRHSAKWGVRDDIMFESVLEDIKADSSQHWMKTVLTLSSHEPWDVPTKVLDDEVYNAFNYLDASLGQFVDSLKQQPVWDNLLLVILPDHGYRYRGIDETTRLYNHIPMIWAGGAVKDTKRIEKVCSQSDLAATLLAQMGIDHSTFRFSRNVVDSSYTRQFAFHTFNNGVTLIDSTGFTCFDLDAEQITAQEGPDTERQLRQARALLQLTSHDLISK